MRSLRITATALLLLTFVLSVPSSAGWIGDDYAIKDIFDDVANVASKVGSEATSIRSKLDARADDLRDRAIGIKDDLGEMLPRFREGVDAVQGDLDRLIDLCLLQARTLAQTEAANLEAFLGSPAEQALRTRLKRLVTQLELSINDVLAMLPEFAPPCGSSLGLDLSVNLASARDFVDSIPGTALYPLFRAQQVVGNVLEELEARLACVREYWGVIAEVLRDNRSNDEYDEVYVENTLSLAKVAAKALWVRFQLLTLVGGQLESAAKTAKLDGEVAIWGWVGGGIDVDGAGSLGKLLTTLGKVDKYLWEYLTGRIRQQEMIAYQNRVLAGQAEIIANQKRLFRAIVGR